MNVQRMTGLSGSQCDALIDLYIDLHENPELSLAETRTAQIMADQLRGLGFTVHEGIGGTGVVGLLHNGTGNAVLLRADMDGLPIVEETGLRYASTVVATDTAGVTTGVMHACGHDVHMVCLLGAAEVLIANRSEWSGTLVVVFQPAEEIAQGAQAMVDDGLFTLVPRPVAILGQHVGNRAAGTLSYTVGPAMAAADSLRVVITGRGAHGSRPQASIDPVLIAASIVVRLQSIVSREISPADIAVVTVGSIHSGTKENIIPSSAELTLSLRSLTPTIRQRLMEAVSRIVRAECAAAGVDIPPTIEHIGSFPVLINEASAASRTVTALETALGKEQVHTAPPVTISEDFGLLAAAIDVPSFFWFLGSTDPVQYATALGSDEVDQQIPANHSSRFAPVPALTITTGVNALVAAFSAWATPKQP